MSMISEQVKHLLEIADRTQNEAFFCEWYRDYAKDLRQAADTIEALSAKLQATNMEQSTMECDRWIPCSERLPEENEVVILTFRNSAGLHVGEATYKKKMFFYVTDTGFGYYEEVYKSPIAWQPLPKPCRKEA